RSIGWPKPTPAHVVSLATCVQRRCLSSRSACRIPFAMCVESPEMCVESPLKYAPPAALQTGRYRVPPGCRPRQRAGAARQRPGGGGAGGGGGRGRRGGGKRPFEFPIRL